MFSRRSYPHCVTRLLCLHDQSCGVWGDGALCSCRTLGTEQRGSTGTSTMIILCVLCALTRSAPRPLFPGPAAPVRRAAAAARRGSPRPPPPRAGAGGPRDRRPAADGRSGGGRRAARAGAPSAPRFFTACTPLRAGTSGFRRGPRRPPPAWRVALDFPAAARRARESL